MKTRNRPVPRAGPAAPAPDAAAVRDHVILCGLANLGVRIYSQLAAIGVPVVVVDRAPEPIWGGRVAADGGGLVAADARLPESLAAAGIATARALITTFDNDLTNLEVVLAAARLRPDLRVVMRFFNVDLAPSIQAALPQLTVLSVSKLAAPAFVAAATDPNVRSAMVVDDQVLTIAELTLGHAGTLERLTFARSVVLAWQRGAAPPVLFPGPSQPVAIGDQLIVIGPEQEVRGLPALLDNVPDQPPPGPGAGRLPAPGRLWALLRNLDRALYLTLAVLTGVIAASVGVFAVARQMPPLDALVLVFGVISTTGIGWFSAGTDPAWLKLYVIGLMVTGTAVLTVIYAFVTNYIVSVKLSGLLGQQPVTLRQHVVVTGLGTVGYRVVSSLLASAEAVAVVERDDENRFLPLIRRQRQARVVIADAKLHDTLELAGVAHARCLVTATSDDMANIQTALIAREINPGIRVVLRTFDPQLAQQMAETFGLEVALSATALAAPAFVARAASQTLLHRSPIAGQILGVARLIVPPQSAVGARALGPLLAGVPAQVLYSAPAGGAPRYHPPPTAVLGPGDALLLIAPEPALREIARRLQL
ncbi:MAG TPA: NAD-binding protein [Chloroflexia bacterium]|nr:NAD-binding protein [Chloroflexia bacterium]